MNDLASLLRLTGARFIALLMVLAMAVLWHPRPAGSATGAGPADALLTAATLSADKGQAPRATLTAKRGADDRGAGAPPGLVTLALDATAPVWLPVAPDCATQPATCPASVPGARQAPRAPPLA